MLRKILILILIHVLVLGGLWWWRYTPDSPEVFEATRINVNGHTRGVTMQGMVNIPGETSVPVTIKGPASLSLWIYVPESEMDRVRQFSNLEFSMDGFGENLYAGRVADINPDPKTVKNRTYYRILVELILDQFPDKREGAFNPVQDSEENEK